MTLLSNKLLKEAAPVKQKEETLEVPDAKYSVKVISGFPTETALEDVPEFLPIYRYCLRNNVSIRELEDFEDDEVSSEVSAKEGSTSRVIELLGDRGDVRKVWIKFFSNDQFANTKAGHSQAEEGSFGDYTVRVRPRVAYSHDVAFDIKKLPAHQIAEIVSSGVFVKDYNDDAKTARIVGAKPTINRLFHKYFAGSEGTTERVKESLDTRWLKIAGVVLKEDYAPSYDAVSYDDHDTPEPSEVSYEVTEINPMKAEEVLSVDDIDHDGRVGEVDTTLLTIKTQLKALLNASQDDCLQDFAAKQIPFVGGISSVSDGLDQLQTQLVYANQSFRRLLRTIEIIKSCEKD